MKQIRNSRFAILGIRFSKAVQKRDWLRSDFTISDTSERRSGSCAVWIPDIDLVLIDEQSLQ